MTTDTPVTLTGVTRRFGSTVALDDVSLTVRPGEIVGLLGPNGAGKTALLSLVEGLRRPDSGTVRLFGLDPREPAARVRLGTTPQETGLPPNLKVSEVVDFVAAHYPDPVPTDELLATFGLTELAGRQTGGMSGGQKRRLAVALAVVGRPDLVLLDEPTTGLDVDAAMSCGTRCARSTRLGRPSSSPVTTSRRSRRWPSASSSTAGGCWPTPRWETSSLGSRGVG